MKKTTFKLAAILLVAVLIIDNFLSQGQEHPPRLTHFLIEDVLETLIILIIDSISWIVSFIGALFTS